MESNENITNEPNNELGSLIKLIQERAKYIKVEDIPFAKDIVYEPYILKRGAEQIMIPAPESTNLLIEIIQSYLFAAFSEDLELIDIIKKRLELKPNEEWFYDLKLIVSEIKKISSYKETIVDELNILKYIHDYVGTKILATIVKKYDGYKDGEPISVERARNYRDTLNKANREGRNIIQNKEVQQNEEALKIAGESIDSNEKDNFQKLQSFAKGNCESDYFPEIYNDFIKTSIKITQGEKLLLVFDLFSMIIKDRVFHTEEEFYSSKLKILTYDTYRQKVIKDILQLK